MDNRPYHTCTWDCKEDGRGDLLNTEKVSKHGFLGLSKEEELFGVFKCDKCGKIFTQKI